MACRQRVFLSAAPADATFADRLAADLEARDIVVWTEQHTPGEGHAGQEERLRQAIRAAQAGVLVVSSQTRSSRTVKKHLRLTDLYRRPLILVWVGDDEHAQPPSGWPATVWVDARDAGYAVALEAIEASLGQRRSISALLPPSAEAAEEEARAPRNPYKGLHAFTATDAGDFFGRERLVDALVKDVAGIVTTEQPASEGERLLTIIGPSGSGKSSVAWSPDGKRLASASFDHTVRVWDASTGSTLVTYTGHTAVVNSVAWSPDGKRRSDRAGVVVAYKLEDGKGRAMREETCRATRRFAQLVPFRDVGCSR